VNIDLKILNEEELKNQRTSLKAESRDTFYEIITLINHRAKKNNSTYFLHIQKK
jgi:hypothetical protein